MMTSAPPQRCGCARSRRQQPRGAVRPCGYSRLAERGAAEAEADASPPPSSPPPLSAAPHLPPLIDNAHLLLQRPVPAAPRVVPPLAPKQTPAERRRRRLPSLLGLRLTPRMAGLLGLNVMCMLFGSNVAVVKGAQEALGPWASAGRFAVSALCFSPFLPAALRRPAVARAGAELGLLAAVGYASQAWGLGHTSASHTAFLGSFTVLLVPLLAGLGGAAVPPRTWAATAVALSGLAAMELLPALAPAAGAVVAAGAAPHGEGAGLAGDAASVLSASFFALQLVRTQHHSARLAGAEADSGSDSASASASGSDLGPGSDAEGESGAGFAPALVAAQLFTLALLFALAAAVQHLSDASSAAPHAAPPSAAAAASASAAILAALPSLPWAAWLFTGLVSTAGPLWAETEALRVVSAPDAALVYSAEPVWGAAAAAALLGERWSGATWLGAALILSASVYGQAGGGGGGGGGGDGDGKEEGGGGAAAARAG